MSKIIMNGQEVDADEVVKNIKENPNRSGDESITFVRNLPKILSRKVVSVDEENLAHPVQRVRPVKRR